MAQNDTTAPEAGALFREGRLAEAVVAAGEAARRAPTDAGARILLAELLLLAGDPVRADAVLSAAAAIDPSALLVVAEFRQLLRAAMARRQVLGEGRLPDFLGEPVAAQRHLLQALVALRAGDTASAAEAALAAEAARPAAPGLLSRDGASEPFEDFRDACDLWGGTLEVLTTTGRYFWVPVERIAAIDFHPARRPRDLAWRRCTLDVRDGPDGDVYVPALYDMPPDTPERLLLGRATDWSATPPVRGSGQRVFLVGEDGIAIHQLAALSFA
ncbi:Protein of avirulence locus ImpE [Rhodovastum atsumiense]|uniref:Tetratricopeptide repeat protein n=1 Tax=Rhodovastum atsumiense TaxID=504468 RepID=A0A5M6IXP3_9PROT|nr:type VI secretion system accessory protein TagJ [Rhodovastum atsumiense]KAA5612729.1 tetratricopeptide repeat protein [Rhodovastum atsumiense]CAH2602714.1 Protein of avirulence locus ImpE [Rhodovastum atsumiense]